MTDHQLAATARYAKATAAGSNELVMSEYWFLVGVAFFVFWAIDPLLLGLDNTPLVKHVPLAVLFPGLLLSASGALLFTSPVRQLMIREMWRDNRALFCFTAFALGGSIVARVMDGIPNSFATMGLFPLLAPVTAWLILRSRAPHKMVRMVLHIFLFWAIIAALTQIAEIGNGVIFRFHNAEHIVLPALMFVILAARSGFGKASAMVFLIVVTIAARKNTAYLVFLISIAYMALLRLRELRNSTRDTVTRWAVCWNSLIVAAALLLTLAASYLYLKESKQGGVPSGNPEYRLVTYERAWNKFLASPVVGNGFTGPASELFGVYEVAVDTQVLPTHSDILDILANGGVIALGLWGAIYLRLARRYVDIATPLSRMHAGMVFDLHTLIVMVFAGVFTCSFNPILNAPNLAGAYWMLVGMLQAVLLLLKGEETEQTLIAGMRAVDRNDRLPGKSKSGQW